MTAGKGSMTTTPTTAPPVGTIRPSGRRARRSLRPTVGAAAALVVALLLSGCWSANQTKELDLVNASRKAAGRTAVGGEAAAMKKAQAWSQHMADTGVVEHTGGGSRLDTSGLPRWCKVAENVGKASSTQALHDAWMRSAVHKANILGPYDKVGVGIVRKGNVVYGTLIFFASC